MSISGVPYPDAISIGHLFDNSIPEPTHVLKWGEDIPKHIGLAMLNGETALLLTYRGLPFKRIFKDVYGTIREGEIDPDWKLCVELASNSKIIKAGVDPSHQTDHCDDCNHVFEENEERVQTCTHTEYVTLCETCYQKAGSDVR